MARVSILGFISVILYLRIKETTCDGYIYTDSSFQYEQKALIDFKSSLKDPNNRLSSWKGSNYCYWQGITCENDTGFIISIDLHNPYPRENVFGDWGSMSLSGEISPSLINFKSLKYLDLSFNSFNGMPIPQFFGSLKNLIYMNLSGAGFSGAIPSNLGNLSKLQYLDLSSDYFDKLFVQNIEWMTNLVSLKYLGTSSVNLSMVGSQWIEVLNKLPILTELHLGGCSLFGSIPSSSFVNFTSLAVVTLRSNRFNSRFPEWLLNVSSLVSIDISSNELHGRIPLGLGELPNLQYLDLSWNLYLGGSISQLLRKSWEKIVFLNLATTHLHGSIPSSIGRFCNLKYLDLSHNIDLNGSLPEIINGIETCNNSKSPLPNLRVLYLNQNQLIGKLPNWLGELKNLRRLTLSGNQLEGPITAASLCTLLQLESLDLSWNYKLYGSLPDCIGQLYQLKVLDLSYNQLSGTLSEQHFLKLSNLEYLNLYFNSFHFNISSNWVPSFQLRELHMGSCHVGPAFPAWLQSQKNLEILDLSGANISSEIPKWFWDIVSNLHKLDLSSNQLQGSIPGLIGNFSNLYNINLGSNQLSGTLSEQHFWNLSYLNSLNIDSNSFRLNLSSNWAPPFQLGSLSMGSCHIGPEFPAWLQSQKYLWYLDLSNASISSSIPNWFWNISSNLHFLILSHNQLQGQLPANSNMGESLPNLVFFSLSGNKITGAIPDSIGQLTFLEVVDFSRNNMIGSVPSALNNCSRLIVLDLGNNNLSGMIPNSLGQLQLLKSLHLNHNKLSGELPSALQNLTGLDVLDLSYNQLSGGIPAWVGTALANLVILNLRSNMFSGRLPNSLLSSLSSLHVLDLAHNNLMGEIPESLVQLKAMTNEDNYMGISSLYQNWSSSRYEERLTVITKGLSLEYTRTLSLVVSIDLSHNNFSGEFPEGVTKLFGLVFLNLSMNHITGRIPENISMLRQLSSLDLSSNDIFGSIASSMSLLSFLGYLNLSNNNLSGKIPFIGHMSTFAESAFAGNPNLCGTPLAMKCPDEEDVDERHSTAVDEKKVDGGFFDQWFYLSIGLGFAVGILVPYLVLAIARSCSDAYFGFVDKIVKLLFFRRSVSYARNHAK